MHGLQEMPLNPVTQKSTITPRRPAGCRLPRPAPPPAVPQHRGPTPGWPSAPHSETRPPHVHHPTPALKTVSVRRSQRFWLQRSCTGSRFLRPTVRGHVFILPSSPQPWVLSALGLPADSLRRIPTVAHAVTGSHSLQLPREHGCPLVILEARGQQSLKGEIDYKSSRSGLELSIAS